MLINTCFGRKGMVENNIQLQQKMMRIASTAEGNNFGEQQKVDSSQHNYDLANKLCQADSLQLVSQVDSHTDSVEVDNLPTMRSRLKALVLYSSDRLRRVIKGGVALSMLLVMATAITQGSIGLIAMKAVVMTGVTKLGIGYAFLGGFLMWESMRCLVRNIKLPAEKTTIKSVGRVAFLAATGVLLIASVPTISTVSAMYALPYISQVAIYVGLYGVVSMSIGTTSVTAFGDLGATFKIIGAFVNTFDHFLQYIFNPKSAKFSQLEEKGAFYMWVEVIASRFRDTVQGSSLEWFLKTTLGQSYSAISGPGLDAFRTVFTGSTKNK